MRVCVHIRCLYNLHGLENLRCLIFVCHAKPQVRPDLAEVLSEGASSNRWRTEGRKEGGREMARNSGQGQPRAPRTWSIWGKGEARVAAPCRPGRGSIPLHLPAASSQLHGVVSHSGLGTLAAAGKPFTNSPFFLVKLHGC